MNYRYTAFLPVWALLALSLSACGVTQTAPKSSNTSAKINLVLPDGVSLKPGGVIHSSGGKRLLAAKITGITLTVTATGMTDLVYVVPLSTMELGIDVPSGPARTFAIKVVTDIAGVFSGSQTVDLAPGATIDLTITVAATTTPDPPTSVQATASDQKVAVSWNPVVNTDTSDAATYNVYWKTSAGVTKANGAKITGVASPYSHSALTNGTTYYYVVTSVNAAGESAVSTEASATPQVSVPSAPTGVGAVAGNAQATVSWGAVTSATSYNVYYGTTSGVTTVTGTKVTGATSGSAVTGLTNGTTYYFIVTAVNAGGESVASAQVSATPQVSVPVAPTGVGASAWNEQTTVSWTAVTGATSYNVYYGTSAGVTTLTGTKITGATSGGAITGLTNGTTYYFIVTAVNAGGESAVSTEASATPLAIPSVPSGVSATAGDAQATVSWTAVTGATSYNVYYGTTSGVTTVTGTKVTGATSGGAITGLTNGMTYYFIVTAVNAGAGSVASAQVSATPQVSVPSAPTGVGASAGNAQATVSWGAVTGATSYNVYYGTTSGVTTVTGTKVAGATSGSAVTGLTNGITYYFIVTAVNAGGESVASAQVSATPQVPAPGQPTGLNATAGNAQVSLAWTAVPAIPNATITYSVYRSTASGTQGSAIATGLSAASHTDSVAVNGTTYYYSVTAVDAGGESAVSTQSSATPVAAPSAPTPVGVISGDTQVTVTWSPSTGATSYNIYWSATSGITIGGGGVTKITGATSPYPHTGRTNGTMYYYVVTAVNAGGESAISAEVATTPMPPAPAAPTGVTAISISGSTTVSWGPVSGATSYNVYHSSTSGAGTGGTKVTGATSGGAITGLTSGTTYYFVVTAQNAGGEGPPSSPETSALNAPSAPTAVTATGGINQATVSWGAVTGATSYNVYYRTTAGVTTANGTKVTGATSGSAVTGLAPGTTYYFVVTAQNAGGEGLPSSPEASALTAPSAPTAVTATGGINQATVSWTASPSATSYNVYYRTTAGVTTANGTKVTGATSGGAVTVLTPGTTYYFVVTAQNAGGEGPPSFPEASATTAPAPPTGVSILGGNIGQAAVSWTASPTATSYNVYYDLSSGVNTSSTKVTGVTSGSALSTFNLGTTYYFIVTAVNGTLEGAPSTPASVLMWPSAPTGVGAASGNAQATVSWGAVTGATSYNVYYAASSANAVVVSATNATTTKVTGATSGSAITGLTNGTTYYFIVTAVNAGGESVASSVASATPQVPAPGAPTGLSPISGVGQVTLSWTAPAAVLNEISRTYNVYYYTTSGVSTSLYTAVISGATSGGVISGLTSGTTYYFIVTCVNAGGETSSGVISATPKTIAPTGLTAVGGNGNVALNWGAVSGATTYNVYYGTTSGVTTGTGTPVIGATSGSAVTGLTNGTTYYFIVTAVNAGGESAASGETSGRPGLTGPTGVTASPGGATSVKLKWDPVGITTTSISGSITTFNVSGTNTVAQISGGSTTLPTTNYYKVYWSTTTGVTPFNATGSFATIYPNYYDHTGLTTGTTYYYVVTWLDPSGVESAPSAQASATPAIVTRKVPDTGQTTKYSTAFGDDSDYLINAPSYNDNLNGTITDNVTGLMWQKQDDGTIRTWDSAVAYCPTLTLGGYSDWRLPSKKELISIVNYGASNPAINAVFTGTQSNYYWSSATSASDTTAAWYVSFIDGYVTYVSKASNYYIRCVRGQQTTQSFADNGNGTVTDNVTTLMWQKQDDATVRTWESAITYCEGLSLGGHTDWRLPNVKELESITDDSVSSPAVNATYFPGTVSSLSYWSSTTGASTVGHAWSVPFDGGSVSNGGLDKMVGYRYVRCVRGGP